MGSNSPSFSKLKYFLIRKIFTPTRNMSSQNYYSRDGEDGPIGKWLAGQISGAHWPVSLAQSNVE